MVFKNIIEVTLDGLDRKEGGSFRLPRRRSKRLSSTRGLTSNEEYLKRRGVSGEEGCGWVRVFTGFEEPQSRGTLVYLTFKTTVKDVCRDLLLGEETTVWVQYGGGVSRRLSADDAPLSLQHDFLATLGYKNASRCSRLGIDPELRHLFRLQAGPAVPLPELGGLLRCGRVYVLKGLVFPQWRTRPVALMGSTLFIYPGLAGASPEVVNIQEAETSERTPRQGRLVLRVAPREGEGVRHVFLGFNHSWQLQLWHSWLQQAAAPPFNPASRLDLSNGCLDRLPEVLLSFSLLQELILSRNSLGNSPSANNLHLLASLPELRVLRIPGNGFEVFPLPLLELTHLVLLDLSDNNLKRIPQEISKLTRLEEFHVDRNELQEVPASLGRLKSLHTLLLSSNRLVEVPAFFSVMRTFTTLDLQGKCVEGLRNKGTVTSPDENNLGQLDRVNLRANLLKGNIILGNYGNLTQLDVSENSITSLDLSALDQLQSVQCSKNQLTELTLHGRALTSLIAGNNKLKKLLITPAPVYLKHLDVSYNELEMLPMWTAGCLQLRALFASHNKLRALPEHLFCGSSTSLQTLQLSYNQLGSLPPFTQSTSLQELFLQSNSIATLPASFFPMCPRLRVLNMSNNRLYELPTRSPPTSHIEKLYLSANCLTTMALEVIIKFEKIRIFHAAYNCLTILPDSCIDVWSDLEELVLSGNKLQYLPENIVELEHLRVLRVHSNRLQTCPCFGQMVSLKVLDLAHNHLDRVNLATLVPTQLQFLDLSCNSQLFVDPRQFQVYRTQRPMSLVDVSGQNRTCLPTTPFHEGGGDLEPPWKVGFSETAGHKERLYVTQVRLPAFCNTEGLFGLFDGGNNNDIPNILIKAIPRILLEERTVKETATEYMKYTMLSAHRELKERGQKYGVCAILCHITRSKQQNNTLVQGTQRYVLRVASVGEARIILSRRNTNVNLSTAPHSSNKTHNKLGCSSMFPLVIPDPHVAEVVLEEQDEFLIVANKRLWEVISEEEAANEVRATNNPILAAKKLQDLAQGYGCEENLSIMVVKFHGLGSDLEQLMQELRHTINKGKENQLPSTGRLVGTQQQEDSFYNNGLLGLKENHKCDVNSFHEVDRSSPSGQSDQASSESVANKEAAAFKSRHTSVQQHNNYVRQWEGGFNGNNNNNNNNVTFGKSSGIIFGGPQSVLMHENGTRKISTSTTATSPMERRSYRDSKRSANGGVLKAIRAKLDGYSNGHLADEEEETNSDQSGTQPSEEQFKCWEYMLEQNTQLLFDKELDTLSRAFARQNAVRPASILDPMWPQQTSTLRDKKALSRSSPHLSEATESAPFLSRHFGSARSFNPVAPASRFNAGRHLLNGGPNAAYFGSLQRLMPYNLEYNFSVIQERRDTLDSLEQDGRMQQYWGVATTEL